MLKNDAEMMEIILERGPDTTAIHGERDGTIQSGQWV